MTTSPPDKTEGDERQEPDDSSGRDTGSLDTASWLLASSQDSVFNTLEDAPKLDVVDRYRILEPLGEGGMGNVYLADQLEPIRRRVALKVIRFGMNTREVVGRFEAERQTLGMMTHPNIATVYDAGVTSDGRPYFVMEYVEGGVPITDFCDQELLPISERLRLFALVCEAIHHAHQKAVIHRDIKPSNILVAKKDGRFSPKVIDFGIARAIDRESLEKSLYTETGNIVGTPAYMSPEQTESSGLDVRSDVYSLGVLLYEMLVGTLPLTPRAIKSGNLVDLVLEIRERDPPPPSSRVTTLGSAMQTTATNRLTDPKRLKRQLHGDADWITMKALEKDPKRRYASAAELALDVGRHLDFRPVSARPPSLLYRAQKFVRRNRWQVTSLAGALFLLVSIGVSSWVSRAFESNALLESGRNKWNQFQSLKSQDLEGTWLALFESADTSAPPWERRAELEAWQRYKDQKVDLESLFGEATERFSRVYFDVAPPFSSTRGDALHSLSETYFERYKDASVGEGIRFGSEYFKRIVKDLGVDEFIRRTDGRGLVTIETEPQSATVHCFRYENVEAQLLPLPFQPSSAKVVGKPFLRVWKVRDDHTVFRPHDRLVSLQGSKNAGAIELHTRSDLADALEAVSVDMSVEVTVIRAGKHVTLSWIPFPESSLTKFFQAGRLRNIYDQLGILFEGYPLDLNPACQASLVTGKLTVTLPEGSYLFVATLDGFSTARIPLVVTPDETERRRVRLLRHDDVPAGFIHVPAGKFPFGDDPKSYEGARRGEAEVQDFFIQREEVTYGDYLEFINDPKTLARLAKYRKKPHPEDEHPHLSVRPNVDWSRKPVARLASSIRSVQLIPRVGLETLVQRNPTDVSKGYRINPKLNDDLGQQSPALGVPVLAALEYALWFTQKHDSRWRFRLPSDLEWEKAARGADRRYFVWGDYPLFAFANTQFSQPPWEEGQNNISPVGLHPIDESVYGVLDMGGCTKEPVINTMSDPRIPEQDRRWCTLRGADWDTTDPRDPRIVTRNRRISYLSIRFVGFRLVAGPGVVKAR